MRLRLRSATIHAGYKRGSPLYTPRGRRCKKGFAPVTFYANENCTKVRSTKDHSSMLTVYAPACTSIKKTPVQVGILFRSGWVLFQLAKLLVLYSSEPFPSQ